MAIIDYFPPTVAADTNGNFARNAEATVYALSDTTFSTPLAITDLQGVPMAKLTASAVGIYPPFRVVNGTLQIVAVSGDLKTPMTSLAVYAAAAETGAQMAATSAGAANSAAATAVSAQAAAFDAAARAEQAALPSAQFVGSEIARPGSPAELALRGKIVDAAGPLITAGVAGKADAAAVNTPVNSPVINTYDTLRNVFGIRARHLRRFRGRLAAAAAGAGICEVAAVGDSIVAGQGATDLSARAWPAVARKLLHSRLLLPAPSTGWAPVHHANAGALKDPRWVLTGTWVQGVTFLHAPSSSVGGSTATFTSDVAGTVAELYYSGQNGAFTVSIDGGTAVTVPSSPGNEMRTYTVTGLANTTHTITVTVSSTTAVYVYAARVRSAAGLSLSNWGFSSAKASDWLTVPWYLNTNSVISTNPALVLVGLGTNEAGNAVSAATYQANMITLVDRFRANSDVVLLAPIPLNGIDQSAHRTALYNVAQSRDLPIIDLAERWLSAASALGLGMYSDGGIHPSDVGYADMGNAVAGVLAA